MITDESVLVTADCVVSEGEAEADDGSGEECHEHGLEECYYSALLWPALLAPLYLFLLVNFCEWSCHEVEGETQEGKHSQQMGPYISLAMDLIDG